MQSRFLYAWCERHLAKGCYSPALQYNGDRDSRVPLGCRSNTLATTICDVVSCVLQGFIAMTVSLWDNVICCQWPCVSSSIDWFTLCLDRLDQVWRTSWTTASAWWTGTRWTGTGTASETPVTAVQIYPTPTRQEDRRTSRPGIRRHFRSDWIWFN